MPSSPPTAELALSAVLDDPLEQTRFTRWSVDADGRRTGESSLQVSGMWCAACAGTLEQALMAVPGVAEATVSAAAHRATVRWDPERTRPTDLIRAIRDAGYDAVPDAAAESRELRQAEQRTALWRFFVASFCAMQVMMMATPSYLAGPGDLAPDMRQLLNWGSWVLSIPVVWFSAAPFFSGAWRAIRQRRIGMDVPVALGVLVTFIASTGATFDPGGIFGHEVYFDSLTMFVSFLLGGRFLEMRARHRAARELEAALSRMPETALRETAEGRFEEVSLQRLAPGDRVRVLAGQAFPADGRLEQGQTQADESLLSGESVPVLKREGDEVVGGSANLGAPVVMRVERTGADTRYEAIVAMMRGALTQRPAMARLADRWAGPFLWVVLLLAAGAAAAWSVIDPSKAVWVAVSVLIVTCPCALSLAAPATLVAAAGGLARRGVTVQRLDALENLARADRIFIDKTGTLTEDRPALAGVRVLAPGGDRDALLAEAGSLAAWSRHPLSQALAAAAGAAPEAPSAWRDVDERPGLGLCARDGHGREWRLGRSDWALAGDDAPTRTPDAGAGDEAARVVLARDGQPMAEFAFEEQTRPGAAEAVRALRAEGLRITLLSGDAPGRASALADRLGIEDVVGGASPEDKLAAVAQAQAAGERVAMVGDGINDAPVIARADVSLAMGQGALVARAQADAVITSGRPAELVTARRAAVKAVAIVRQNIVWAAVYNAACVPLALVGWLPPWAAGLGMAGSSLLVIGNAMRASR